MLANNQRLTDRELLETQEWAASMNVQVAGRLRDNHYCRVARAIAELREHRQDVTESREALGGRV